MIIFNIAVRILGVIQKILYFSIGGQHITAKIIENNDTIFRMHLSDLQKKLDDFKLGRRNFNTLASLLNSLNHSEKVLEIFCPKNNSNEFYLVVLDEKKFDGDSVWLYVSKVHPSSLNNRQKYQRLSAWKETDLSGKRRWKIGDIQGKTERIGSGTALMDHFFLYLESKEERNIYGYLGPADIGHRDRQKSYYNKFGFNISFKDKSELEGEISKTLSKVDFERARENIKKRKGRCEFDVLPDEF